MLFTFLDRGESRCVGNASNFLHFSKYVDWFDFCLVQYLEAPEIIFLCHGLPSSIDWHRYGKPSSCRYMILPGKPCVFHVKLLSHWRLLYDIDNLIPFGNFDLDVETQTYWQIWQSSDYSNILSAMIYDWLVVWNIFICPYIGNVIIPTDEVIFFQRGRRKTTNQIINHH